MLEIANMNSSFFTGDINAVSAPKRNVCVHQYRHTHTKMEEEEEGVRNVLCFVPESFLPSGTLKAHYDRAYSTMLTCRLPIFVV